MADTPKRRPVVLCVLDGWGYREDTADNAVALADTRAYDSMVASSPHALLRCWGPDVGLPEGQMGNSEVGHMNLGAGRVVNQELVRIGQAIADGSLAGCAPVQRLIQSLRETGGTCHLLGLVSDGGVHSHQDHIVALARVMDGAGIPVALHAFLDGRDTAPSSGAGFMRQMVAATRGFSRFRVATVSGRYWGMDRDKRWDREAKAYDMMVDAVAQRADDPVAAIEASYAAGITDEFMAPTAIGAYLGMKDGDGILSANFRADRIRQILTALLDPGFDSFKRRRVVRFAAATGMAEYSERLNELMATIFPPQEIRHTLGEIVAEAGLHQLRIAETEKYAHVTFFFNGGEERALPGEERILVPSPRVATYDLQPEMSSVEVTVKLVAAIESGRFDFILVNYASADMVGHPGILDAEIKAIEAVDRALDRVDRAVRAAGGVLIVTADHGNAECMRDVATGERHTQHTVGPVPVLLVNPPQGVRGIANGRLADVAPTVLRLLGLPQPADMTGHCLLLENADDTREHGAQATA